MIWAVVPLKRLELANTRLAPVLSPDERRKLAINMMFDVLSVLKAAKGLDGVLVASEDETVNGLAWSLGVRTLDDHSDDGLSETLIRTSRMLRDEGATGVLSVHADLPLITPEEINILADHIRAGPAVALAPAQSDLGTNILAMSPPGCIDFAYGFESSRRHAFAALAKGIEPALIRSPGTGFDLDTPDDLIEFARRRSDTRTDRYLEANGIRDRVLAWPFGQPAQMIFKEDAQ